MCRVLAIIRRSIEPEPEPNGYPKVQKVGEDLAPTDIEGQQPATGHSGPDHRWSIVETTRSAARPDAGPVSVDGQAGHLFRPAPA
jgi:hypothetical protein